MATDKMNLCGAPSAMPSFCLKKFESLERKAAATARELGEVNEKVTAMHTFLLVEDPRKNGGSLFSRMRVVEIWKKNISRVLWAIGTFVALSLLGAILSLVIPRLEGQ